MDRIIPAKASRNDTDSSAVPVDPDPFPELMPFLLPLIRSALIAE